VCGTITYVTATATPNNTPQALVYARQSKVIGDDELAVLRQQEDGNKLADLRGWHIARTLVDNDISAAGKAVRPGFEAALKMIEAGTVKAIIAWDLTRLTRNARDRLRLIDTCSRNGVTIALVRGADIDPATPGGRLVAGILGEVAEHEIAQKADRQRRAAQQAAEAGRPYQKGRRAFGYEHDGVTLRPAEADALRQAYSDVLHGVPLARIARDLNAKGLYTPQLTRARRSPDGDVIRAPQPSPWTAQTVSPMLLSPRYAGLRARTVRPERGRPTWDILGRAVWEPVVSEEVWQAVRDVLAAPDRRNAPRSEAGPAYRRRPVRGVLPTGRRPAYSWAWLVRPRRPYPQR
jgi:site-specific DNA recombinase